MREKSENVSARASVAPEREKMKTMQLTNKPRKGEGAREGDEEVEIPSFVMIPCTIPLGKNKKKERPVDFSAHGPISSRPCLPD